MLWDTIHKLIKFVRMSTIWRDIALPSRLALLFKWLLNTTYPSEVTYKTYHVKWGEAYLCIQKFSGSRIVFH